MNDDLKHTWKPAPGEKLTDFERARLREGLMRHMTLHPLPPPASLARWRSEASWSFYFARAGAFAALVLMLGGGISYAAQSSVPGDLLYSVKRSVNEPVAGALALSARAQAGWKAELAERRLAEAETLASRGGLDSEVAAQLSAEANINAQAAAEKIAALGESDPDQAAVAAVKLTAALSAHGAVLNSLGEEESATKIAAALGATTQAETAESAALPAPASKSGAATMSIQVEPKMSADSTSASGRVAAFKKAALDARERARAALERTTSLSKDDFEKATATLVEVDAALFAGAEAGQEQESFRRYKEALRKAQSLSIVLKAASSFKLRAVLDGKKRPAPASPEAASATMEGAAGASGEGASTTSSAADTDTSNAASDAPEVRREDARKESGRNNIIERILAPLLR